MASAPVLGGTGTETLDDAVFGQEFNEPLVHECVKAEQNARRQGTASTKTRGEVRGGGAKPWKQKGTGRARAGSSRSPIWTGGGVIFGPKPRKYTVKVNKKAYRAALRSVLSLHAGRDSLAVLDVASYIDASTKRAVADLAGWDRKGKGTVCLVLGEGQQDVERSFRNIEGVKVRSSDDVGVVELIGSANVLIAREAIDRLVERAAKEIVRGSEAEEAVAA